MVSTKIRSISHWKLTRCIPKQIEVAPTCASMVTDPSASTVAAPPNDGKTERTPMHSGANSKQNNAYLQTHAQIAHSTNTHFWAGFTLDASSVPSLSLRALPLDVSRHVTRGAPSVKRSFKNWAHVQLHSARLTGQFRPVSRCIRPTNKINMRSVAAAPNNCSGRCVPQPSQLVKFSPFFAPARQSSRCAVKHDPVSCAQHQFKVLSLIPIAPNTTIAVQNHKCNKVSGSGS